MSVHAKIDPIFHAWYGRLCVCILFGKVTEKNHKRSLYQKVALIIFIIEYFTITLL